MSYTEYLYKKMTVEIVDGHIAEANEFYEEHGVRSKTGDELVRMENGNEMWVCTILMYASILNDAETFSKVMTAWTRPTLFSMADYCDYYWPAKTTFDESENTRELTFNLWRHGRGDKAATFTIRHEADSKDWDLYNKPLSN